MSTRDILALGPIEERPPLRNGRSRGRSPLNSTVNVGGEIGGATNSELSVIQPPVVNDSAFGYDSYRESPVGRGCGTILNRQSRNSVELFSDPNHIESELDSLSAQIEDYGENHQFKPDWMSQIVSYHSDLKGTLELLQSRLVLSSQTTYFDRVRQMETRLGEYKRKLLERMVQVKEGHENGITIGAPDELSMGSATASETSAATQIQAVIPESSYPSDPVVSYPQSAPEPGPLTEVDSEDIQIFLLEGESGDSDNIHANESVLPRAIKDVIEATNRNIKVTNEKHTEIMNFQSNTEKLLADLNQKADNMTRFVSDSDIRFKQISDVVEKLENDQVRLMDHISQVVNSSNENSKSLSDRISTCSTALQDISLQCKALVSASDHNKNMIDGLRTTVLGHRTSIKTILEDRIAPPPLGHQSPASIDSTRGSYGTLGARSGTRSAPCSPAPGVRSNLGRSPGAGLPINPQGGGHAHNIPSLPFIRRISEVENVDPDPVLAPPDPNIISFPPPPMHVSPSGYPASNPGIQNIQVPDPHVTARQIPQRREPLEAQSQGEHTVLLNSGSYDQSNRVNTHPPPRNNDLPAKKIFEHSLKQCYKRLTEIVDSPVDASSSELTILESEAKVIPQLEKLIEKSYTTLGKYALLGCADQTLIDQITEVIENANDWASNVSTLYRQHEMYSVHNSKGLNLEVKPFDGSGTQTVYQFLRSFEGKHKGRGTELQRAEILYNNYLSPRIRSQTSKFSTEYSKLKIWLIDEYGDNITVSDSLISNIENMSKPGSNCTKKGEYFLKLDCMIKDLKKTSLEDGIDKNLFNDHISSQQIVTRMVLLLPYEEQLEFKKEVNAKGFDTKKLRGEYVFTLFSNFVENTAQALDSMAPKLNPPKEKPKAKPVVFHATTTDEPAQGEEDEEDDLSLRDQPGLPPAPAVHAAQRKKPAPLKQQQNSGTGWYDSKFKHPCPIKSHSHEIYECNEFFSANAKQRKAFSMKKLCFSCLGPRQFCTIQKNEKSLRYCQKLEKVGQLICQGCVDFCKHNDIPSSPFNVLLCPEIAHSKPSKPEVTKLLKELWPAMNSNEIANKMVFHLSVSNVANDRVISSKDTIDVVFNTSTGDRCDMIQDSGPFSGQIHPPPEDPSVYVMQWIRIGSSDCLCFFDTGANIHMVSGDLAERERVKIISQNPTTLKVVGGSEVITEYGTFMLNLGPDVEGSVHSLVCHGIDVVAGPFPRHNLTEINAEFRASKTGAAMGNEPLPEYLGGSEVHLLIGIHSSAQPVYLTTLLSGISVYRSPFRDRFGSQICYAGSHKSFKTMSEQTPGTHFMSAMQNVRDRMRNVEEVEEVHNSNLEVLFPSPIFPHSDRPNPPEDHVQAFPNPLVDPRILNQGIRMDPELSVLASHSTEWVYQPFDPPTDPYAPDAPPYAVLEKCSAEDPDPLEVESDPSCHRATIPIARLRNLVTPDDTESMVTYRCPSCSRCTACKQSPKNRAMTLTESVEQRIIEASVSIDYTKKSVFVDLPFLKDPVPPLREKHRGTDNYKMALQVYVQQCRKPEHLKEGIRKAHSELVERGFMVNLLDLDQNLREGIVNAPFRHFYPWRMVAKEDSVTTPCRLIVDPTMTGLNILLAKGENRLGNLAEILIRNRVKPYAWSSDISKMYNQLKLKTSSLPYSLFLFDPSLDASTKPQVFVMTCAWYGVVPSGNQAGFAIEKLVEDAGETYVSARESLTSDRYVDDVASGSLTEHGREEQIESCRELLESAGFKLKFVARSGHPPCEKASSDGTLMKMLGYTWGPVKDTLSPGISELNFNKRLRGARKPNVTPVVTQEDARQLLKHVRLTRKMCASKVAELFDPIGIWEPMKVKLKLQLRELNHLGWDDPLTPKDQEKWKDMLVEFVHFPSFVVPRCVVPEQAVDPGSARLVCCCDAASNAGGAALYIGYKLKDGSYSNQLLTSKSKLMSATIPRNELGAILLMSELAYVTVKALNGLVKEIVYFTDSTIAMSWCHNVNKKLRLYVKSRVETIRLMMEWTDLVTDKLPLYHIDGLINVADILTKEHDIRATDMGPLSEWNLGPPWMTLPVEQMPLTKYEQLCTSTYEERNIDSECFQEKFQPGEADQPRDQRPAHQPRVAHLQQKVENLQKEMVSDACHIANRVLNEPVPPPLRTLGSSPVVSKSRGPPGVNHFSLTLSKRVGSREEGFCQKH